MQKDEKNLPKKQGNRGNLPLPVDVIDELRQLKRSYELAWSDPSPDGERYSMTYEQLIRHLMEGVKLMDPEVWATHQACEKTREEQRELMANFRKDYWGQLLAMKTKLDGLLDGMKDEAPADAASHAVGQQQLKETPDMNPNGSSQEAPTEGDVWDMKFFFKNNEGEELEAMVGTRGAAFYCVFEGRETCMTTMMNKGWKLINDSGMELTKSQAVRISETIKQHWAQHDKEDNQV